VRATMQAMKEAAAAEAAAAALQKIEQDKRGSRRQLEREAAARAEEVRATMEAMKEAAVSEAHTASLERIEKSKRDYLEEHLHPAEQVLAAHEALADRPPPAAGDNGGADGGDDGGSTADHVRADVRVDADARFWLQEHAQDDDDEELDLSQDHVKGQVASLVADEVVRQKAFSDQKTPEVLVARTLVKGMLMGHEQRKSASGQLDKAYNAVHTQELPAHRSRAALAAVEARDHYRMARSSRAAAEGTGVLW